MISKPPNISSSAPLIRANSVQELIRWLTRHGRPIEALLEASGLAKFDLSDPDNIVPMLPVSEFVRLAQSNEGPDIGCQIVTPATFSRLGSLGQALLNLFNSPSRR